MRARQALLLLTLAATPIAGAATFVVAPDSTGDLPTIQAAVDSSADGDVVLLTDGVFRGDGNRDVAFRGKAITVRSQTGDRDACVVDCEGTEAAPHRGFVFENDEGRGSSLEDVTIRGGCAEVGGGVLCVASAPTIAGCVLTDCTAWNAGGGLAFRQGSAPDVRDCVFRANYAGVRGGGAYGSGSSPEFTACLFADNFGVSSSGGLECSGGGVVVVRDCEFRANHTSPVGDAGAVGVVAHRSEVTDCVFVENGGGFTAGGIDLGGIEAVVTRCTFSRNASSGFAGAISTGAENALLLDCTMAGNESQSGGAIACGQGALQVMGCTLVGNAATIGSGIWLNGSVYVYLEKTIVASGAGGEAVRCESGTGAEVCCCDFFGNAGGDWTGRLAGQGEISGNFSRDPLFCDAPGEDFTLRANSPCAPAGQPFCGLIGALPVGCPGTPVERTTWGGVKALFRR